MTAAPRIAKNITYNLLGQAVPALVHLVSIPLLIRGLGNDRFALLSIVWMLIGYSTLLDLGIPRSLTGLVAARIGARREGDVPAIVGTGLLVLSLLGLLLLLGTVAIKGWLIADVLKVPAELRSEAGAALLLTAACLPLVVITGGIRGALEGEHRFGAANLLRTPLSVFMLVGPLAVVQFTPRLEYVIGALAIGRLAGLVAHLAVYYRTLSPGQLPVIRRSVLGELLHSAGWMTVVNLAGGAMSEVGRFLVGYFFSLAAITYYSTPYDTVSRALILPAAIMAVGFPAFSEMYARERAEAGRWFARAAVALWLALGPLIALGFIYTPEALRLWLGDEFVRHSSAIMRVLLVGVLVNGLTHAPFALLQGAGRADLTGKLQLLELPIYVVSFWLFSRYFGLVGAALAWTFRVSVDAALNFGLAARLVPESAARLGRVAASLVPVAGIVALAVLVPWAALRAALAAAALVAFFALAIRFLLDASERAAAARLFLSRLRRMGLSSAAPHKSATGLGPPGP